MIVAQTSKSAVSQCFQPAGRPLFHTHRDDYALPIGNRRYSRLGSLRYDDNARRAKEAKARRDKEVDEIITIILLLVVVVVVLGATGWFVYEAMQQCNGNCSFQKG